MKVFANLLVLSLFTVQSTLALPAHHRIQAQAIDLAANLETAADQTESELAESAPTADKKWVQKLEHQLKTRGHRKFMARVEKDLVHADLTDLQKEQTRGEAERQIETAIPVIVEKARAARSPIALVRQMKQEMKEAREQAKNPSQARSTLSKSDRQPAQFLPNAILALALAIIALSLLILAISMVISLLWYLAPVIVVAVVICIVV
jgi:hypothetical protein